MSSYLAAFTQAEAYFYLLCCIEAILLFHSLCCTGAILLFHLTHLLGDPAKLQRTWLVRIMQTCSQSDQCSVCIHVNIPRGLPCRLDSLRLNKTHQWIIICFCRWGFVWVNGVQWFWSAGQSSVAWFEPDLLQGLFMALSILAFCLEYSFHICHVTCYFLNRWTPSQVPDP